MSCGLLILYCVRTVWELSVLYRIFNMSAEKISKRSEFLIQFLDLPSKWRLVVNLSGGQQRWVRSSDDFVLIGVLLESFHDISSPLIFLISLALIIKCRRLISQESKSRRCSASRARTSYTWWADRWSGPSAETDYLETPHQDIAYNHHHHHHHHSLRGGGQASQQGWNDEVRETFGRRLPGSFDRNLPADKLGERVLVSLSQHGTRRAGRSRQCGGCCSPRGPGKPSVPCYKVSVTEDERKTSSRSQERKTSTWENILLPPPPKF